MSVSLVGQDLEEVPADLIETHSKDIVHLDLSANRIRSVPPLLQLLPGLHTLILDNNLLSERDPLPCLPQVTTFWLNNNRVEDLDAFLAGLTVAMPNLTYVSMLKNPCCPSQLDGSDPEEYQRYRYWVVHRCPKLKFLDAKHISPAEMTEAKQRGAFVSRVARPHEPTAAAAAQASVDDSPIRPVSKEKQPPFLRISHYEYQGRESEGNRFIHNSDL